MLSETARKDIFALQYKTLAEAKLYLTTFHESKEYEQLATTENAELSDEDVICFALARKPSDTKKIDIKRLADAVFNYYKNNNPEFSKRAKSLECFQIELQHIPLDRPLIDTPMAALEPIKSAVFILVALDYFYQCIFSSSKNSEHLLFKLRDFPGNSPTYPRFNGYINLSGLDLKNIRLEFVDLSHADLTNSDLSGAVLKRNCFDHALLFNVNFTDATLSSYHRMLNTQFNPDDLMKAANYSKHCFTFEFIDYQKPLDEQFDHLYKQGLRHDKHTCIMKLILRDIKIIVADKDHLEQMELMLNAINHLLFGGVPGVLVNGFTRRFMMLSDTQDAIWKIREELNSNYLKFLSESARISKVKQITDAPAEDCCTKGFYV